MKIDAELLYDRNLVVQGINSHWRGSVGPGFLLAAALLGISLGLVLYQGERSWIVGALGAILLLSTVVLAGLYIHHRTAALARLSSMGRLSVHLSATEAGFTLQSPLGTSTMSWSAIQSISRFPGYWLLYFSRSQFITLPTASLPDGASQFIAAQVAASREHSGAIQGDAAACHPVCGGKPGASPPRPSTRSLDRRTLYA